MTKDEWQEAERRALWKYGGLTLLVDGYKISVQRQYATPYKSKLAVYVNGTFRGKMARRRLRGAQTVLLLREAQPDQEKLPGKQEKVVFEGDGQKTRKTTPTIPTARITT